MHAVQRDGDGNRQREGEGAESKTAVERGEKTTEDQIKPEIRGRETRVIRKHGYVKSLYTRHAQEEKKTQKRGGNLWSVFGVTIQFWIQ